MIMPLLHPEMCGRMSQGCPYRHLMHNKEPFTWFKNRDGKDRKRIKKA